MLFARGTREHPNQSSPNGPATQIFNQTYNLPIYQQKERETKTKTPKSSEQTSPSASISSCNLRIQPEVPPAGGLGPFGAGAASGATGQAASGTFWESLANMKQMHHQQI